MHPMSSPLTPLSQRLRQRARTLCAGALTLLAAVSLPAGAAHAQGLPQGYTSDEGASPGETGPSQPALQADDAVAPDAAADGYSDTDPSALTEFRQPLEAHGTWVDDPTYGTIWVPSSAVVGEDFAPYVTDGHWAMSDEGEWLWVSDYDWGYIPFHYGRWVWISAYGWSWIPGRVYAPAWVVWRTGDYGYVGWAPMPPAYYWSSGVAVSFWAVPTAAYVFCPTTHVFHHHVHTYVVHDRHTVHRVAAHTHPYRPARPSGSGAGAHRPGSPSGPASGARPGYRPASPSLADARIPGSAAPKARVSADPRALGFARKSTTASARAISPAARGLQALPGKSGGARPRIPGLGAGGGKSAGSFDSSARTPRAQVPVLRTPGARPRDAAPQPRVKLPTSQGTPRISAPSQRVNPGPAPRIHPAPRAQSPSPRISVPRSSQAPRAKAPTQNAPPRASKPSKSSAPIKIHKKK